MLDLIIKKMLTTFNFVKKADTKRIKYIVIHYFGSLGTAQQVAYYFATDYRGASAHYCLDEGKTVFQCVEDGDIAWHCGTKGEYYHPECRNDNSIGIEVRPGKINKTRAAFADDTDWYFTDEVINNLVEFTKHLMVRYNIDADHVIRHYDVTHKLCPRPFVGNDINDYHNVSGNLMWAQFKARLIGSGDEDMNFDNITDEEVDVLLSRIVKRLSVLPVSDYARPASIKGVVSGIFADGDKNGIIDNPQGFMRRQELAVVLDRVGLLDK